MMRIKEITGKNNGLAIYRVTGKVAYCLKVQYLDVKVIATWKNELL